MRFLISLIAFHCQNDCIITGDNRMKKRPIDDLVDSLVEFGVKIEYLENQGYPPIKIHGEIKDNGKENIGNQKLFIAPNKQPQITKLIPPPVGIGFRCELLSLGKSKKYFFKKFIIPFKIMMLRNKEIKNWAVIFKD